MAVPKLVESLEHGVDLNNNRPLFDKCVVQMGVLVYADTCNVGIIFSSEKVIESSYAYIVGWSSW